MSKTSKLFGIFPVPIYKNYLNRKLTKDEISFFEIFKEKNYRNIGNHTSLTKYILNNDELKNLKTELTKMLENYFTSVLSPKEDVVPYITQSWLNWTKQGEHHHKHNHPNSIVSGVFYINADEEKDFISFYNEKDETVYNEKNEPIILNPKNFNVYNTKTTNIYVETGTLLLFPSWLSHSVPVKSGNNLRTSLAFNTFVKESFELKL
jgi:uncharacterized protein (TIGR02466 family)